MEGLEQKVALVTGGGSGIGEDTVKTLARSGAKVVIADVDDAGATRVADEVTAAGGAALAVHLDVADEQSWRDAIARVKEAHGALHVVVNNAGVPSMADVESEDLATWEKVVAVNQTGVWLGMREGGPLIEASGGGSIVNVSSILGTVGSYGVSIAYQASKGAVRIMTKSAAVHWATKGVRVNSVHPGFIRTSMMGDADASAFEAHTPMARLGTSQEIANAITFLASDLSSYMTGSEVYVDGGFTAD